MTSISRYYLIYKPYGMLCQFTKEGNHPTLADIDFTFPKDVYPVGRLDTDSEGLLILSNDKKLNQSLLNPKMKHTRSYYVQVEGMATDEKIHMLEKGILISINGKPHKTLPCKVSVIPTPVLPDRVPPIRFRKNIPTSWIQLQLHEGKNRQVRRMTAAIGFPTLRLVRYSIEQLDIQGLLPGEIREMEKKKIYTLLKIENIA